MNNLDTCFVSNVIVREKNEIYVNTSSISILKRC